MHNAGLAKVNFYQFENCFFPSGDTTGKLNIDISKQASGR